MVRAATWLHFGSGGSCGLRVSTTITSTPRQARSMASVSPTGPAPTINTWVSSLAVISCSAMSLAPRGRRIRRTPSFDLLDVRLAYDSGPFGTFRLDPRAEFFWRVGDRLEADCGKTCLDVRQRKNANHFAMPKPDDLLARASRSQNALREDGFLIRKPCFRHSRHLGQNP